MNFKKSVSIFALAASAFCADAADAPECRAKLVMAPPKVFFTKLTDAMRRVYPDPETEMKFAFSMMPFGFPSFNGISESAPVVVCAFNTPQAPTLLAVIKADENSNVSKLLAKSTNPPATRVGDKIVVPVSAPDGVDMSGLPEAAAAAAKRDNADFLKLDSDGETLDKFFEGKEIFPPKFFKDIERLLLNVASDRNGIVVHLSLDFKDGSGQAKFLQSVRRFKSGGEARLIPQDAAVCVISSLESGGGFFGDPVFGAAANGKYAEAWKTLASKSEGGFALASVFDGAKTAFVTASKTSASPADLAEFAKKFPRAQVELPAFKSGDEKISVENSIESVEAIADCLMSRFSAKGREIKTSYAASADGWFVASDDKSLFAEAVRKAKMRGAEQAPYPLKKYAEADSDFTVILNNRAVFAKLLESLGVNFKGDISETVLLGKVSGTRVSVRLELRFETLRAYADIIRNFTEAKKAEEKRK